MFLFCHVNTNFTKLSREYQSYPKSTKIYAIEQKICKCHSPSHHSLFASVSYSFLCGAALSYLLAVRRESSADSVAAPWFSIL